MEMTPIGDQLVLSGAVKRGDDARAAAALASHPEITTVVLRNSPGGDADSGYRLGELLRRKRLKTALSGYCFSSCSRMFLGGSERFFTDDYPPESTHVGFHGHYRGNGRLWPELMRRKGLKQWIVAYSDGKADAALVERWINIPSSRGMIHFYHPGMVRRNDASTFLCQGTEDSGEGVFGCEPVAKTALELGIVTSLELVHSHDQAALRAPVDGVR